MYVFFKHCWQNDFIYKFFLLFVPGYRGSCALVARCSVGSGEFNVFAGNLSLSFLTFPGEASEAFQRKGNVCTCTYLHVHVFVQRDFEGPVPTLI